MHDEQARLMLRLQQVGMTMDDLREYADTHPFDETVIDRFNMAAEEYAALKETYSRNFTPLCSASPSNDSRKWAWGLSDFPWEK